MYKTSAGRDCMLPTFKSCAIHRALYKVFPDIATRKRIQLQIKKITTRRMLMDKCSALQKAGLSTWMIVDSHSSSSTK